MTGSAPDSGNERLELRRELRARRRAVQGTARLRAARQLAQRVNAARLLRPGKLVGLYLSTAEEIDTAPLLALARARGCRIALPRIVNLRHNHMRFYDWAGGIRRGALGINEPRGNRIRAAGELEVVFVPLVGFDSRGNRIGMGRGFYDRHFARRLHLARYRRPLLVGLAYDVQRVAALPRAAHDVPLDVIVTQSSIQRFHWSDI